MDNEKKVDLSQQPKTGNKLRLLMNFMVPIVIIVVAVLFFKHQMATRPKAKRAKAAKEAKLVEAIELKRTSDRTEIEAMGTVVPSKEVTLSPEVTGIINSISETVIPGGIIHQGQLLFQIDSRDYETIVEQRRSAVAQATLDLKLESGNQAVAKQEYQMLEEVIEKQNKELILRKPHLQQIQAELKAAQALLEQAKLDVGRCSIKAPFNAIIKEKYQDVGARVSPSSSLITITGVDEYWIKIMISESQLQWIHLPDDSNPVGSNVKIYNSSWKNGQFRKGNVISLLAQFEQQGRMAQLLVSVKDPLCLKDGKNLPKLIIDSYVRVTIEGAELVDVFKIKRQHLRDGNSVWIMNGDNKLEIKPVNIIFRNEDYVYIDDGIGDNDLLITTDIAAPVESMDLRLE